jgi:hypothetical protein
MLHVIAGSGCRCVDDSEINEKWQMLTPVSFFEVTGENDRHDLPPKDSSADTAEAKDSSTDTAEAKDSSADTAEAKDSSADTAEAKDSSAGTKRAAAGAPSEPPVSKKPHRTMLQVFASLNGDTGYNGYKHKPILAPIEDSDGE